MKEVEEKVVEKAEEKQVNIIELTEEQQAMDQSFVGLYAKGPYSLRYRMSMDDRTWLGKECARAFNDYQYQINRRQSPDNTLRAMLMADHGMTLEQVMDLKDVSPEQMKAYFQEFFDKYANPNKTAEENIRELGKMKARAYKVINDSTIPAIEAPVTLEKLQAMETYFGVFRGLEIDLEQDYESLDTGDRHPDLKRAFFEGTESDESYNLNKARFMTIGQSLYPILSMMEDTSNTREARAQGLYVFRDFFKKYGGKKLSEFDPKDITEIIGKSTAVHSMVKKNPRDSKGKYYPKKEDPAFEQYLKGEIDTFPTKSEFDKMTKLMTEGNRSIPGDDVQKTSEKLLKEGFDQYAKLFTEQVMTADNVLNLPKEVKDQIGAAYFKSLSSVYDGITPNILSPVVKDAFDLFNTADGKTIRQFVNEKYPTANPVEKHQAMVIETMRQAFDKGIKVDYYTINDKNEYIRKPGFNVKGISDMKLDEQEIPDFEARLEVSRLNRELAFMKGDSVVDDVLTMTPDEISIAASAYKDVFGPIFQRAAVKEFRQANPTFGEMDFFKVGGLTLKEYIGQEKFDAIIARDDAEDLIQAEIMRIATDPRIPLSFTSVRKDYKTGEFKHTAPHDVLDVADKERILTEKPYLKSMDTYKEWFKKNNPNLNVKDMGEDDWHIYYQGEVIGTAERGLLPEEDITSKENLMASVNSDIPSEMGLQYIYNIYGAKPKLIKEFVGNEKGENRVYTSEEFRQLLAPVDSGSFTNEEFALMAYVAAMDPDNVTGNIYPEAGAYLSQEDKVYVKNGEWTTALKDGKLEGDNHLANAVSPTRNIISQMINRYEESGDYELGITLRDGIKNLLDKIKASDDLMEPNGEFAYNGHVLKGLMTMLKKGENEELYNSVIEGLSPDEMDFVDATLKLVDMHDQKCIAQNVIKEAKKDGADLDPELLEEHIATIATFDHFAKKWLGNTRKVLDSFKTDKEYNRLRDIMMKASSKEGLNKEEKLALSEEARINLARYERSKIDPPKELIDELNQDEVSYEQASLASQKIKDIRNKFGKHFEDFKEARKVTGREQRWTYPEDITPQISMENRYKYREASFYLTEMLKLVASGMDEKTKKNIYNRYNELAKEKKWDAKKYDDSFALSYLMNDDNDKLELFMNVVLDELESSPHALEAMGDLHHDIMNVRTPLEKELKDIVDYTHDKEIQDLKEKTDNPEDIKLLDEVNMSLAQRTERAKDYIFGVYDPERPGSILENRAGTSLEEFDKGQFEGFTENGFENKSLEGTDVSYTVQKNPGLIDDLKNNPATVSSKTKEDISTIIKMIKDAGFVDKNAPIENSGKIYVHQKLLDAKVALSKAVKSGDIEKIREANEKYKEQHKKMEDIFNKTEELFGKTGLAPGNVDTIRNGAIPPEFSTRVITDSRVNGLFQVACMCEKLGITPEEYISNPGKYMLDYVQKGIKEKGFKNAQNYTERKENEKSDFIASYRSLFDKGVQLSAKGSLANDIEFGEPSYVVGRCINGFALLEQNQEKLDDIERYEVLLSTQMSYMVATEEAYEKCVYDVVNADVSNPETEKAFKAGLKTAFMEGGMIEKHHLPVDAVDENGKIIPKHSYEDVLKKPDMYKKIIKDLHDAADMIKDNLYINMDLPREAIQETMFDYLMAHPEDSMKPEYKELEKEAFKAMKTMGDKYAGTTEIASQYKKWKKEFHAEQNMLYDEAKEKDTALNKQITSMQKRMKRMVGDSSMEGTTAFLKATDSYKKVIDDRLKELVDDFRNHKITETYFTGRTEALLHAKESFNNPINGVPKFFDENNPDVFKRDNEIINERVKTKASASHLNSLANFKRWKLEQMNPEETDILGESELSQEEWKGLYEIELANAGIKDRPLPKGYKEIDGTVINENDPTRDNNLTDFIEGRNKSVDKHVAYSERKQKLYDEMTKPDGLVAKYMSSKASDLPTDKAKKNMYEKNLKQALAETIAAESYERLKGQLPKGVTEEVFARRLMNSESFERLSNMLLNALYSASGKSAGKDADRKTSQKAEQTAKSIIKLVDNKAIISACSMDQKYLDEIAANKGNPEFKYNPTSPGITKLNTEFKNAQRGVSPKAKEHDMNKPNL